jgi:hypothetical protein
MFGQSTTPDGLPLPGHSIPYAFTQSDISNFLSTYSHDPIVSQYMWSKSPPYGVIWNNPAGYGQLLLWFDASGVFHIVDVTNLSIAKQVQKAPYESPDSSLIDNIIQQIQALIAALPSPQQALTGLEVVAVLVGLYLVYQIVRGR